ncbi:heme-binding protein [Luteimonas saliphila]|uniref:heme-binding protein n=1 Tax=Luteimonas saliphila TaxID=2804919 RepID=UPI00192D8935|nr:heme-binding protein [Luteimonas saliphila]
MKHVFTCLIAIAFACSSPGVAAQGTRAVLESATADAIRNHCLAHAAAAGFTVAVAVFDHGGDLVSFARHDGATPATTAVAHWKGRSAAVYLNPTADTGTWNMPTAPMIATIGGGMPLFTRDGIGIGGVGVSGAPPEFDAECGTLAAQAAGLAVAPPGG